MNQFSEIEHKFLIVNEVDRSAILKKVLSLKPKSKTKVDVVDHYYYVKKGFPYIFRHRIDSELQQFTLKSFGGDNEQRLEINLDLAKESGDQREKVKAILSVFEPVWEGKIEKEVEAFYFPDCEIVYYVAQSSKKKVSCFEIEAIGYQDKEEAISILKKYERLLGLSEASRCKENLFDLLLRDHLPS